MSKKIKIPKIEVFIGNEEVKDRDIKAIILMIYAIEMGTPRMRMANLEFVLSGKRIKKLMGKPITRIAK